MKKADRESPDPRRLRIPTRREYQGTLDFVSSQEYLFTRHAVSLLEEAGLYPRLTRELQTDEDFANPTKWPLLFEARFAYELFRSGVRATYEHPTGVQGDSVDFRFSAGREWLVELVSPQVTDATLRETQIADHSWGMTFSQTPDAGIEATRLADKIIEKVADAQDHPRKFPPPVDDAAHMIVVDTRRFHSGHADRMDYRELPHGAGALPKDFPFHTLVPGKTEPIKGFFEKDHPYPRTRHLRERVHFVAFIAEKKFEKGEIPSLLYTEPNPNLFADTETAFRVFESFPLRRLPPPP